jgi:hypothetical protein
MIVYRYIPLTTKFTFRYKYSYFKNKRIFLIKNCLSITIELISVKYFFDTYIITKYKEIIIIL